MTMTGYKYQQQPIEELSRADMLAALIEANEHIDDLLAEVAELKSLLGDST